MFSKTWRIHYIFTYVQLNKKVRVQTWRVHSIFTNVQLNKKVRIHVLQDLARPLNIHQRPAQQEGEDPCSPRPGASTQYSPTSSSTRR